MTTVVHETTGKKKVTKHIIRKEGGKTVCGKESTKMYSTCTFGDDEIYCKKCWGKFNG